MVRGIESFRDWFRGYEKQYVIIGGTACDLLMTEEGLEFRATKDIDIVLIIEALDAGFGSRLWEYVIAGGYEYRNKSTGKPQFYRFTDPQSREYPAMIELFTRKPNAIILPEDAVLSPLPVDEDVSSLSAILLEDDYYDFLQYGRMQIEGITVLDALHLIPFKAKAWLDLSKRRNAGEQVDSKKIRKHRNDVFRLTELLDRNMPPLSYIPTSIKADMQRFIEQMESEEIDLEQSGIHNKTKENILEELRVIYG